MTKVADIKRLYTDGWAERPEWVEGLVWHHDLWAYAHLSATSTGLLAYCLSMQQWETPDKRIVGPDGSPYLDGYCIAEPRGSAANDLSGKIYLHHFHRGDADAQLHNHPWDKSISLILLNGYLEERRGRAPRIARPRRHAAVNRYIRRPGDAVEINRDTFHRVDLPYGDAWTLFFAGPYIGTWHFWDRDTGQQEQWEDFLRARGRLT